MTTETQNFISLAEIKGLRYECTNCKTRFSSSLDKSTRQYAVKMAAKIRCPTCGTTWFQGESDSRSLAIQNFLGYLLDASDQEVNFESTGVGLKIMLEIEPLP